MTSEKQIADDSAVEKPTSDFLVFIYFPEQDTIIQTWDCHNEKTQDNFYNALKDIPNKPDNIEICKGKMTQDGDFELIGLCRSKKDDVKRHVYYIK